MSFDGSADEELKEASPLVGRTVSKQSEKTLTGELGGEPLRMPPLVGQQEARMLMVGEVFLQCSGEAESRVRY